MHEAIIHSELDLKQRIHVPVHTINNSHCLKLVLEVITKITNCKNSWKWTCNL